MLILVLAAVAVGGGYFGSRLEKWASRDRAFRRATAAAIDGIHELLGDLANDVDDHNLQMPVIAESVAAAHAKLNASEARRAALARWEAN